MYSVEVEILTVGPSLVYLPSESVDPEWFELTLVPQLGTDEEELAEARRVAVLAREYWANVRITEGVGDGARRVVE